MMYFGLLLWCSHRSCHVFGRRRCFSLFAMKSVWLEMGLRSGTGMFHCMCLLFGVYPSDLETVWGFWRSTRWMKRCFILFSEEAIFPRQVSCWQAALLVSALWSPPQCWVSLCRGVEEDRWGFLLLLPAALCPLSWLLSACDCHSDGTRVTAAYALSYIVLQDSWLQVLKYNYCGFYSTLRQDKGEWNPVRQMALPLLFREDFKFGVFLKIIYENPDQIMQLFLAISTSSSWEHYQQGLPVNFWRCLNSISLSASWELFSEVTKFIFVLMEILLLISGCFSNLSKL